MSLTLDIDVLVQVMSLVERRGDLVSLMQTCHTLYNMGISFLFRPYYNTNLKTIREFHSFASFLFSQPLRCLLVRQLTISIRDFCKVPGTVDCLVWLLHRLSFLEDLALLEGEMLLDEGRYVGPAIGRLKKLKRFTLRNPPMPDGEMIQEFLSELSSPLESLDVGFLNSNRNDYGYPVNPLKVFSPLTSHLKHLAASYVFFTFSGIEYPEVESLSLDDCVFASPGDLVQAFPNLKRLKVSISDAGITNTLGSRPVEDRRRYNIMNQLTNRWESLDELSGTAMHLYALALRTPIRHIDVSSLALEPGNAHQLAAILAESRPTSLKVHVHTPKFSLEKFEGVLIAAQDYLKRLDITIDISTTSTLLSTVIDELARIMAGPKPELSHLWLRLVWNDTRVWISGTPPLAPHPIELDLKALSYITIAERMKEGCSSLQYVAVEASGRPIKYWEAVNAEGDNSEKLTPIEIELANTRMSAW